MTHRRIGIISADDSGTARQAAERIATTGQHVLLFVPGKSERGRLPKNIEAAPTPTDIAFDCDVVLSFIDDSLALRDLLIGTPDRTGLGAEMSPGSIFVDFGARPPRENQALLGVTGMRGVAIVDAAYAGSGEGLIDGSAVLLVGGYPDAVDTVEPILTLLGRVDRTGPLGSAHTAAALMGYMEAAHRIAHEEAVSVGRALGLSVETLARVLDSDGLSNKGANVVSLARRTGLALRLAMDRGVPADVIDFTGARLALNRRTLG
jgi:3-hydroxyisobutyrate dehydrogenase